jgi:hypothetical protein
MKKITMVEIEQYWKDLDYSKIQKFDINDFCFMWAYEEEIELPEDFSIAQHNSMFFTKINSEKHTTNGILKKMGYPIIETEELTMDLECAIMRAKQLFRENGHGVIRANNFAGGGGTYIIKQEKSIPMMISTLLNHPKKAILPLYSPYYKAEIENGVYLVAGKVKLAVEKHLNPETGLHNLSLGAKATVVKDQDKLEKLQEICEGLSDIFGIGFGRIDIMETEEGYKIVELSVPNFKKFALQDRECMQIAKNLFLTYYKEYYK